MSDQISISLAKDDFNQLVRLVAQGLPRSGELMDKLLDYSPKTFPFKQFLLSRHEFLANDAFFARLAGMLYSRAVYGFFISSQNQIQNFLTPVSNSPFVELQNGILTISDAQALSGSTLYLQTTMQLQSINIVRAGIRDAIVYAPNCQHIDMRWNELRSLKVFASKALRCVSAEFNKHLYQKNVEFFDVDAEFCERKAENVETACYLANPSFVEAVNPAAMISQLLALHPELADAPVLAQINEACAKRENFGFLYMNGTVYVILQGANSLDARLSFDREFAEFSLTLRDVAGTLFLIYLNRARFCQIIGTQLANAVISCPNCYRVCNVSHNSCLKRVWVYESRHVKEVWRFGTDCELSGDSPCVKGSQ